MIMYCRSKVNGVVFDYNELLAKNSEIELVTEEEAYPEKFAPVDLKKYEKQIEIVVPEETVAAPVTVAPELTVQRGRTFNDASPVLKAPKPAKTPKPAFDVSGLKGDF